MKSVSIVTSILLVVFAAINSVLSLLTFMMLIK